MSLGKGLSSLIPQQRKTVHKETAGGDSSSRIWHIPITEIAPNAEQPRKTFSHHELEQLVLSVKQHGILQPVLVTEKGDGGYELIAGERRLRAAQIAGLLTVPAIVRTATQKEKLELAVIENVMRQDLNPIEEAFAYRRLAEEFSLTQEEIASRVGKSRPVIANMTRLLDLPDEIQRALIDGTITIGKGVALLSLKDPKEQIAVFRSMAGERATVRDVERVVSEKGVQSRKGSVRRDPNVMAQERLLED
ncbi:MAG: ParB/RepB/Spo0J family partition protein, partial [Patescibacteria group bacterium]